MGKTTDDSSSSCCNVVIAGAGPAGLLLTALLLQRNDELPSPRYRITLIDNRRDLGVLSEDELKKKFRSWMLGLAGHGVGALKQVRGGEMFEKYCKHVGIALQTASIHVGEKEIKMTAEEFRPGGEKNKSFVVDRNFIVASLARYVNDVVAARCDGDNSNTTTKWLTALYEHTILFVDHEQQQILTREHGTDGTEGNSKRREERYVPYDLLVGCDGAKSVVREAMVKGLHSFEMDVGDIFNTFKAVHVQRPDNVDAASMHLLPTCFPGMHGVALPETGDLLNINLAIPRHLFESDKMAQELVSDDPRIVARYFKDNFKAFRLVDYDDIAQQWVRQRWNRTAQVHCNVYHSSDMNIVLMGDAAHATAPFIGMGMNQALKDAQVFYLMLQQYCDDLSLALPRFSEERVKEGNALSDLSLHLYCMDEKHQLIETLHLVIRNKLHSWFPSLVLNHPQSLVGRTDMGLSDVYDVATRVGVMPKHRRINDKIRRDYFEEKTGMITTTNGTKSSFRQKSIILGGLLVLVAGVLASKRR